MDSRMLLTGAGWVLLALIVLYILVGVGFRLVETRLLYHPTDTPIAECPLPEGVEIVDVGGERALLTATGSDTLVVFYHGNGSRACNWRYLGPNHLGPLGVDTLVMEYPGYADDPRTPSKAGLLGTAKAAREWGRARYGRVIAFGNSIGTAPAAHHAAGGGADQLILFAPFDSMLSLLRGKGFVYPRFVLKNDYDPMADLSAGAPPTVIVHGAEDTLVPARHSATLAAALEGQGVAVTRILRPDRGHGGLFDDEFFDPFLAEYLSR